MVFADIKRYKAILIPHGFLYFLLVVVIICLIVLTSVYATLWQKNRSASSIPSSSYAVQNGIIGFPALLPDDGRYVQWTFLHMNDVYELLPLDRGRKGGLARVAYVRQLLLKENPNTITVLAGDLISPSAIGVAKVNGTALNGKQMIATMNTLGLDYMTFGNHEFDLNEKELLSRMNESTFTWISSNTFRLNSSEPVGKSMTHKMLTIDGIRILIIGLCIESPSTYARFIAQSSIVNYTRQFLTQFATSTYDVLVALTHLDIDKDVELAANIPQINIVLGGHEHEDHYFLRGPKYTPIAKADANANTVYIHRCAYNVDTKRLRIYSTLTRISQDVPEEEKTAAVANYWYNLGVQAFKALGYDPEQTISCLPAGIEFDGRSETVRTSQTLFSNVICESMVAATSASGSTIGIFNSGAIRLDDILRETITVYDILRTLPFVNYVLVLSVPGQILAQVLTDGMPFKGNGMFLSYTGVQTLDRGKTWLVNGANIQTSGLNYTVATIEYAQANTGLNSGNVTITQRTNVTQTAALIDYLKIKYPPC